MRATCLGSPRHPAVLAAACAAWLLTWSPPALAGEGEEMASVGAAYGYVEVLQDGEGVKAHGGVLTLEYQRGFEDTLWWRVAAAGGLYDGPAGLAWSGQATVGLTYAFDVLRWVPYLNAGVGALAVGGGGFETELVPLVELGGGLDVLQSRTWSWGVAGSVNYFTNEILRGTIGLRVTYRWGFF